MPVVHQPKNLQDLLVWEEEKLYSRKGGGTAAGAANKLLIGTPVKAAGDNFVPLLNADAVTLCVGLSLKESDGDSKEINKAKSLVLVREGIVKLQGIIFPSGYDVAKKKALVGQLEKLGILVRN